MDISVVLMPLLATVLPPELINWIHANVLNTHAPFQIYKRYVFLQVRHGFDAIYPLLQPLLDRAAENEGLVGFAALLVVLTGIFLVVSWIHRVIMWWTRLAMRAVFWATVLAVLGWAWQRGPMESAKDAVVVGGKIVGFMASVKDIWMTEYQKYDGQEQALGNGRGRTSGRR